MTGSGLGLASVHSIVRRHGGHVGVTSMINRGATFTIYLPSLGMTGAIQPTDTPQQIAGNQKDGSILVMDDEQMIRDLAREVLTYLGYHVITCDHGEEALSQHKAARESGRPFSAIIMDLTVPGGMGGREAAQHILAIDPDATLIVSSGYSNDPIMANHKAFGFRGAVVKPYRITELAQLLDSLIPRTNVSS
jgi:CheY-like chemotaxis protein